MGWRFIGQVHARISIGAFNAKFYNEYNLKNRRSNMTSADDSPFFVLQDNTGYPLDYA